MRAGRSVASSTASSTEEGSGADRSLVAIALLAAAVVIWGTTPRVTAVAAAHTEPLTLTSLRAIPAALVLVLARPVLRFDYPRGASAWLGTAASGVLMVAIFLAGFTEAVIRAGPGNAIVLTSTTPFFVAAIGRATLGDRLSRNAAVGMIAGFVGVVLIVSAQIDVTGDGDTTIGLICALGAACGWAAGTLIVKQMLLHDPATDVLGLTAGQYLVGGAVLAALSLAVEGTGGTDWSSGELWWPVAFVSVVGSVVATVAYLAALRSLSATRASTWLFLSPVVAVVLEIVLGDSPPPIVLAGMALTIAGVAVVSVAPPAPSRVEA